MNRSTIISFVVVIVVCIVGAAVWWTRPQEQPPPTPAPIDKPDVEEPQAPPPPPPPVVEAPKAPEPAEEAAAAAEEAAPEEPEQAAAEDDPFGGKPITVETLTGCKEVQQFGESQIIVEYAPNGEWKVNGNLRAKWTIEGGRVKIYRDDTFDSNQDEVHYIDIVNNQLVGADGDVLKMTR